MNLLCDVIIFKRHAWCNQVQVHKELKFEVIIIKLISLGMEMRGVKIVLSSGVLHATHLICTNMFSSRLKDTLLAINDELNFKL